MIYIVSEISTSVFELMNDRYFAYQNIDDALTCKDNLVSFWIHDACELEDCLVEELEGNGFEIIHNEPFLFQFLYNETEVKIQIQVIEIN